MILHERRIKARMRKAALRKPYHLREGLCHTV